MSWRVFCFFIAGYIYEFSNANMIIQSCVRNITVSNLAATSATYPTGNTFFITIKVDTEQSKNTTFDTLLSGSAYFPDEICIDFDTSIVEPTVSYNPERGRLITFNILNDGNLYGRVTTLFPDPSSGSDKSAFITNTLSVQPNSNFDGTITFTLYHQIKTSNTYLKIANRNFNVYRKCFKMKRLCIYRGGIESPSYPNDCITELTSSNIQLNPNDNAITDINYLLNSIDANTWQSTPTPTSTSESTPTPQSDIPTGIDMKKCWAPYSQYILIDLNAISSTVPAISSISLGFTADPSLKDSGDTTEIPPRWITFAFDDDNINDLKSDVLTDQYWAVDLQGGNFQSEGSSGIDQYVWSVNPLYFQYDTKPGPNKFRMTQITKGFGLQYLQNTQLQYRSAPDTTTEWDIYAAAYIDPNDVNTVSNPTNQVFQLAEIACKDIFPQSSPNYVANWYPSNTYNACWDYAGGRLYECYGNHLADPFNTDGEVFYPPAGYILRDSIFLETTTSSPYCVEPYFPVNDWSECNVTTDNAEIQRCMLDATTYAQCNSNIEPMQAVPMGWECTVPTTPQPTRMPTSAPTTPNPTKSPTTIAPTYIPTTNPTTYPTYIPTYIPTNNPTTIPTFIPTNIPTNMPTSNPTQIPTSIPTNNPTTYPTNIPTSYPTSEPTSDPTKYPTMEPTISQPTSTPTKPPTNQPSDIPTKVPYNEGIIAETTEVSGEFIDDGKSGNNHWWLWLIITLLILLCCGVIIGVIFYKHNNKEKSNDSTMNNVETAVINQGNHSADISDGKLEIVNTIDDQDIIEMVNKTNIGNSDDLSDDEDIIAVVNKTDIGNSNENLHHDEDIVVIVNETDMGVVESDTTLQGPNVTAYNGKNDDISINETNVIEKGIEHGEKNELIEGVDYDMNEYGAKQVSLWLQSIGFVKYYDNFIQNGFDSIKFIKQINNENDLKDVGIGLKAHRLTIMNHVRALKS